MCCLVFSKTEIIYRQRFSQAFWGGGGTFLRMEVSSTLPAIRDAQNNKIVAHS